MVKLLIVVCLIAVLASLGAGLFYLVTGKDGPKSTLKALTIPIVLSVALFLLLLFAWSQGLIQPHGIGD